MNKLTLWVESVPSPLGPMQIITDCKDALCALDWDDNESRLHRLLLSQYRQKLIKWQTRNSVSTAALALNAYFDGDIKAIDELEVVLGGTDFQRSVWAALREIPGGITMSYGELARRIERPTAVRAVGLANGANPISIVIPCHRVIGANASLTGYGGGLHRKQWLLAHEQEFAAPAVSTRGLRLPGF